jgi:hypothetical protein
MAAARPLANYALLTIPIQLGGTVPLANENMKLRPLDSINFHNGASFPVDIIFTNQFTSIYNLPMGTPSGAQGGATPLNLTLNYTIWNHNTGVQVAGPYSVQFGIGPLPIAITADNTNPDPVAIPKGGQIQFTNNDSAPYTIKWYLAKQPANVWSPQPGSINQRLNSPPQTALAGANGQSVTYTITLQGTETRGGGTVNVGS